MPVHPARRPRSVNPPPFSWGPFCVLEQWGAGRRRCHGGMRLLRREPYPWPPQAARPSGCVGGGASAPSRGSEAVSARALPTATTASPAVRVRAGRGAQRRRTPRAKAAGRRPGTSPAPAPPKKRERNPREARQNSQPRNAKAQRGRGEAPAPACTSCTGQAQQRSLGRAGPSRPPSRHSPGMRRPSAVGARRQRRPVLLYRPSAATKPRPCWAEQSGRRDDGMVATPTFLSRWSRQRPRASRPFHRRPLASWRGRPDRAHG